MLIKTQEQLIQHWRHANWKKPNMQTQVHWNKMKHTINAVTHIPSAAASAVTATGLLLIVYSSPLISQPCEVILQALKLNETPLLRQLFKPSLCSIITLVYVYNHSWLWKTYISLSFTCADKSTEENLQILWINLNQHAKTSRHLFNYFLNKQIKKRKSNKKINQDVLIIQNKKLMTTYRRE